MRRLLLLLLLTASAFAQAPTGTQQKMREAQQAFGAGDCPRALAALREVIAAEPQNYAAHLLTAHCQLRQNDYAAAIVEFRRAVEIRPDAPPGRLGLIQAYVFAGDRANRDKEIAKLRESISAGKIPRTVRFVREQFNAGDKRVIVNEYPYITLLRSRYLFEVPDAKQNFQLVLRDDEFTLLANDKAVRVYGRGEPSYEQVVKDVKTVLNGQKLNTGDYALAQKPAVIEPFPITVNDSSDPRLSLQPGHVAIEYIAHSCFRIHTAKGTRILIDPYASRLWLGYDFPSKLAADAILITHPHYDHDADVLLGNNPAPWEPNVRAMRDPGTYRIIDVAMTGIRGKHADPWGKEFGQTNTIWLMDIDGLRIAHLGDNGPLTDNNVKELGRVDILMMPIDAKGHILKDAEVQAIRTALHPRIVIPMHYRLPDLESPDSPEGLGDIDPWLATQPNVVRLDTNLATFSAATLLPAQSIVVFPHSPKVSAPRP
ncbi:MAG TPA: MBL fold metallo-hydrolase [Thermoanaerobaculia bacterium]|nr:MBL fold metallo-hydrolase [Thermoanaerobaculia bacterium]